MPEEMVIRHCAPTLAGIKTGSMFACRFGDEGEMLCCIRAMNHRLRGKGLRMLPLRYADGVGLVYVFRPKRLKTDLTQEQAQRLLGARGYPCGSADLCVKRLQRRMAGQGDFPHEVGLFLGYPPEDVAGFIERRQARFCGCWKVYGDVEAARRSFARYRRCTESYVRRYAAGGVLEKLAVKA